MCLFVRLLLEKGVCPENLQVLLHCPIEKTQQQKTRHFFNPLSVVTTENLQDMPYESQGLRTESLDAEPRTFTA